MKIKILAVIIFVLTASAVFANTYFLDRKISKLLDQVDGLIIDEENIEKSENEAKAIWKKFKDEETYMSLSVNHDDLTSIEEILAELIGYLEIGDADEARVIKNRLSDALSHLRRLSGVNLDAVI